MLSPKDEEERRIELAKLSPHTEGHYFSGEGKLAMQYLVHVSFYPELKWWAREIIQGEVIGDKFEIEESFFDSARKLRL